MNPPNSPKKEINNTAVKKTYESYDHITALYQNHLEDMLAKHSKVFQTRLDLHLPLNLGIEEDSKQIRDFSEYLTRDLKRNYPLPKDGQKRSSGSSRQTHPVDPRVIWVREKHDQSPNHHFHTLVLVNGQAKKFGYDIHQRAIRQWGNALQIDQEQAQPLVHYCNDNGPAAIMMDKNSDKFEDEVQAAQKQASYLAKTKGKDKTPKHHWKAGGTRLKKN